MSHNRELDLLSKLIDEIEINQKFRELITKKNNQIKALKKIIEDHGLVVCPDNPIHRADY